MVDLASTRIIAIHGVGRKCAPNQERQLWLDALSAQWHHRGVDPDLIQQLDRRFDFVYWADCMPNHLYFSQDQSLAKHARCAQMIERIQHDDIHVGIHTILEDFFTKRGLDVANIMTSLLQLKDNVIESVFAEISAYFDHTWAADRMRQTLRDALERAWAAGESVILLAHSFGTVISYDVLWEYAHRGLFADNQSRSVHSFVTMGSPLGDSMMQSRLLGASYREHEPERFYLPNVKHWLNMACLGDPVSHDSTFHDDFFQPMIHQGFLNSENVRDYHRLYNPMQTSDDQSDPHSVLGYLVQPKLFKWLTQWLSIPTPVPTLSE